MNCSFLNIITRLNVTTILIMMPAWVEHGVTKVSVKFNYYDGYGRYAITSFFGNKQTE